MPWPPQGLYFKKDVNSVADMAGVKFRSYNTATARLAELTGMLPVQIEAAEISQAFATGVAESMISSGATGYDMKVWEHLTNFYEVDAWMPRNSIFVNKDVWNGVSDAHKAAIRGCAELAAYAAPFPDERRHSRMAAVKMVAMGSRGRWPIRSNRSSSDWPDQNFSSNCSASSATGVGGKAAARSDQESNGDCAGRGASSEPPVPKPRPRR